jgi:hypothetical protein
MSKSLEGVLVKAPHRRHPYTEQQIDEFVACADPVMGPQYFMSHFFYIQHPLHGKMLYQPYEFQDRLIETYHNYRFSISMMPRQTGKSTSAAGYLVVVCYVCARLHNPSCRTQVFGRTGDHATCTLCL